MRFQSICLVAGLFTGLVAQPALAQDEVEEEESLRTRIGLGAQAVPSFPGADGLRLSPLVDVSRARGDDPFEFEAPDESFGFALVRPGRLAIGPSLNLEGSRTADDVGAQLPKVGFTVEVGAFAQYELADNVRLRAEMRKGIGGHEGLIGNVGADFVARRGDDWLLSIGPRLTITDDDYSGAYFSVAPADSAASGLPAYTANGGIHSVGATVGYLRQLSPQWGIASYAKYDRLVGDAADSPIVRQFGSRNQISGGLALTYTFDGGWSID